MTTKWLIDNCGVDIARVAATDVRGRVASCQSGRATDRQIAVYNHELSRLYETIRAQYISMYGFN
jgi:hypothetical protein